MREGSTVFYGHLTVEINPKVEVLPSQFGVRYEKLFQRRDRARGGILTGEGESGGWDGRNVWGRRWGTCFGAVVGYE